MVVRRWRCGAATDPIKQIGVLAFEQRFEAVELAVVERVEMGIGKVAENKIGFARAPVP